MPPERSGVGYDSRIYPYSTIRQNVSQAPSVAMSPAPTAPVRQTPHWSNSSESLPTDRVETQVTTSMTEIEHHGLRLAEQLRFCAAELANHSSKMSGEANWLLDIERKNCTYFEDLAKSYKNAHEGSVQLNKKYVQLDERRIQLDEKRIQLLKDQHQLDLAKLKYKHEQEERSLHSTDELKREVLNLNRQITRLEDENSALKDEIISLEDKNCLLEKRNLSLEARDQIARDR
jgi:cell division protein FtsB